MTGSYTSHALAKLALNWSRRDAGPRRKQAAMQGKEWGLKATLGNCLPTPKLAAHCRG